MKYPIDNPFRKPVEFNSAFISFFCAWFVLGYEAWFGISPWVTLGTVTALLSLCVWRFRQGLALVKFQMNLRWLTLYELSSDQLPKSKSELFLGMGFWWNQKHTQRLFMARLPQNEHLRARSASYEWARQYERDHPQGYLSRLLSIKHPMNPFAPLAVAGVGGDPAIHGIEPNEREIWTSLAERVGHMVVLGTTRVGKTRLAEVLITQDIHRKEVVIVFDPKGDVALLKRMYAEAARSGRQNDFWFFHLGYPELSDRYSPVSTVGRITEVATRIANQMPDSGNSQAFKQFVWLYVNVIARTMFALGMNPTYELISRYASDLDSLAEKYYVYWLDKEHPEWEVELANARQDQEVDLLVKKTGRSKDVIHIMTLMRKKGWNDPVGDGLASILSNEKTKYQGLINSLYPLLQKLTTGQISALLSPNWNDASDKRRVFDWDKIMNMGGIVYVGLDSLSDAEVASAVGNAMFADLTSTAGRRYKFGTAYGQSQERIVEDSTKICIHADEFNELIGDEFVPLLNKAGGAGYQVTVYTQTWSDVEAKIGDKAKAAQIGGNLNSMIMLRVKNIETAELLTEQLPKVNVYSTTMVSGTTDANNPHDFSDFAARTEDCISSVEVPMIQPADLIQLPKGQAFALLDGGQLAKIRLPLPAKDNDAFWPASMERVFEGMNAQYAQYVSHLGEEQEILPSNFAGEKISSLTTEGKGRGF